MRPSTQTRRTSDPLILHRDCSEDVCEVKGSEDGCPYLDLEAEEQEEGGEG